MTAVAQALAGLVVLLVLSSLVWVVSVRRTDASIADICWGPGFAVLAWLYCAFQDEPPPRAVLLAVLTTLWAARLAWHIAARHRGEDARYAAMRAVRGPAFEWQSLVIVFWLQGVLIWIVAMPLLAAARTRGPDMPTALDAAGLALFALGLAFETIGDAQLSRFRANPARRGQVLDTGLWKYTRHPNYFGDATLWWGIYLVAVSAPGGGLTIGSPLLMTLLLLRVSGVTLLEQGLLTTRPGYADYVARTSAFIPWFPRRAAR